MKTYTGLWERLVDIDNIALAVRRMCRHKGGQRTVRRIKKNEGLYARRVRELLVSGNFHTAEYATFRQHYPKERDIYKLPAYPDRIVHHAIMQVTAPILIKVFIRDTYSAIPGRGQTQASRRCAEFTRRYRYCLDCDIKRYHENIRPDILSRLTRRYFKDSRFMELLDDIIMSSDHLPTGNYTSQWLANLYLTPFDLFVKHTLHCKGYVRYADNFLLFSNDKRQLKLWEKAIWKFLEDYNLSPSHSILRDRNQGVYFTGYRHYRKYVLIRKSTARRQRRYVNRKKGSVTYESLQSMVSWDRHACSYNFRKRHGLDRLCGELRHESVLGKRRGCARPKRKLGRG